MNTQTFARAGFLLLALVAGAARAADTAPDAPVAAADAALYQALGAQPGIVRLVDDFVARLLDDPRMKPFFADADLKKLKAGLVAQFCEVSGGPCKYSGKDMKKSHEAMDITTANFNALVEVLQQSMDAQGIGFASQNRLLAKLAPMHRDIINVH